MTNYLVNTHPERVISATLGGAGWSKGEDARLGFMNELADSLDAGKGIGPLIERLTPANRPRPSEEQLATFNKMLMLTNDAKALAACIRGMKGLAVTEMQLRANQVPTLALIGADDPLKAGVDELQQCMANLKVEVIPDADHMTAFRKPQFLADLQEFLGEHAQAKAAAGVK